MPPRRGCSSAACSFFCWGRRGSRRSWAASAPRWPGACCPSVPELRLRDGGHPGDARYPTELARRYLLEERFADAARELDRALRLEPGRAEALYLHGLLLSFRKDTMGAEATFESLLRSRPDYAAARLRLGILQIERSEFKPAI